jgi:predicted transcriptional regulator|tara:strand:- start:1309 stop:1446 length:138 start_codon:yes stop_codon:yes gene_type:complete
MVVNRHVVALAERGFINHIPRKQRSVEISPKGKIYIEKYSKNKKS